MDNLLTEEQLKKACELLRGLLAAPPNDDGKTPYEQSRLRDDKRLDLTEKELKPLLRDFLDSKVALKDFKSRIDSLNKRNPLWGFKGVKGQMFFNLLLNATKNDQNTLAKHLREAIDCPLDEKQAMEKIQVFARYVEDLRTRVLAAGRSKASRPNPGSIPYFLSYFWQIGNRLIWPVYYTNSVDMLVDLNFWQPSGDLAADYLSCVFR